MSLLQTFFNSEVMLDSLPALLRGLRNTLVLSLFSILCGVVLGLVVCLIRLYAPLLLRAIAIVYIDLFRAMPMLVILILIYYALPFLGVRFSSWTSAILAFSLVMGAYSAEVFRAGVEGVPRGQFEAAGALGLPFLLTLRRVVLPQAMRAIIPPMTVEPRMRRATAPEPLANHNGIIPKINAKEVMRIGRRRKRAPSSVASSRGLPFSYSSFANSTIKMAFFAASPMSMINPICA